MHLAQMVAFGHLLVDDAAAGGHPLDVAGRDGAMVPHAVAVLHGSREDVCDRFDAAVWMPRRTDEPQSLSDAAQRVLKVLRREHDLATGDLRAESRVTERAAFTRALDELQRRMKVIPQDVIYQPFSYIWTLAEDRFAEELRKPIRRKTALREIARAYLAGAGMSVLGETARASGLSRVEAGSGNHQLVDEGYAIRLRQGIYALAALEKG